MPDPDLVDAFLEGMYGPIWHRAKLEWSPHLLRAERSDVAAGITAMCEMILRDDLIEVMARAIDPEAFKGLAFGEGYSDRHIFARRKGRDALDALRAALLAGGTDEPAG